MRGETEGERPPRWEDPLGSLVFGSPAMLRLGHTLKRLGSRDVTVLITGESGTGKERVAEAVVRASRRADRPFVRFNCAALTPALAEAELFGHTRGAFTGALRTRGGLFRQADGGTLLLDEVAELDAGTQAKLLRALQEGEIRPVGADQSCRVDVRIIAATHRDLPRWVATGRFREDLYYRIKVVGIHLPPLRDRRQDIPVLASYFLARFAARFGLPPPPLTADLLARLTAYSWPGNVRELENWLESALALSADGSIDLDLLPDVGAGLEPSSPTTRFKERVAAYERELIAAALHKAEGNQSKAARLLDMRRTTLQDKMRKYGLAVLQASSS